MIEAELSFTESLEDIMQVQTYDILDWPILSEQLCSRMILYTLKNGCLYQNNLCCIPVCIPYLLFR